MAALTESLSEILRDASIDLQDVQIIGPEVGRRFDVKLFGPVGSGARRANEVMELYWRSGSARLIRTAVPGGVGATRTFVDRDKNKAMVRTEILVRKMQLAMQAEYPNLTLRARKKAGVLSTPDAPVCRIVVVSSTESRLEWNLGSSFPRCIDKDVMQRRFEHECTDPMASIQWG